MKITPKKMSDFRREANATYERLLKDLAHRERKIALLQDTTERINKELELMRIQGKGIISEHFNLMAEEN
tara:strand:+ start:582 stop:791 length:210 start_codon:yes stop_codon:yes gene_type:complete